MKKVNCYEVKNFKNVNTTKYTDGTLFIEEGKANVGVLSRGTIKVINGNIPSLSGYVKKTEVESMINEAIKGLTPNE